MVSVSEDGVGESGLGRFLSRSCLISFAAFPSLKDTMSSRAQIKGCCSEGLCFLGTDCASTVALGLGQCPHCPVPRGAQCWSLPGVFSQQIKYKLWLNPLLFFQ